MNYRRIFFIVLYTGVTAWLIIYLLSPVIFFPFVLLIPYLFLVIIPRISLVLAIIVFFMTKKWFSVERLLSFILLLPILIAAVIPNFNEKINLYKTPTTALLHSYFKQFEYSQPKVLDISDLFISYDDQSKTLDLNIRLIPEMYSYNLDLYKQRNYEFNNESFAQYFMNGLYLQYINRVINMNEFNLRAKHINVHGYWGNELVVKIYYNKIKDEYMVVEPYPDLKLKVENGQGFLIYQRDGSSKQIKVYENEETETDTDVQLEMFNLFAQ